LVLTGVVLTKPTRRRARPPAGRRRRITAGIVAPGLPDQPGAHHHLPTPAREWAEMRLRPKA
jgi:hypothetical protein